MLIDAHAHVDRYERIGEGGLVSALDEIAEFKILTISNSMDIPSYDKNLSISQNNNYIVPIFGIHPWNASEYAYRLETLAPHVAKSPMIGEIGLDFFFVQDQKKYPDQFAVFEYFLSAAKDQNKVVHIHTKGAEEAVYELLIAYSLPRVLIHWYSGPIHTLMKFIDLGAYFTIGIEVNYSEHLERIAELIPLDRILTETDNPGGPKSYIGKPGMPSLLIEVIKALALLKGMPEEDIVECVHSNMLELIGDDPQLERTKFMLEDKSPNTNNFSGS